MRQMINEVDLGNDPPYLSPFPNHNDFTLPEDVVEQLTQDEDEGVRNALSHRNLFPESKLLRSYINMLLS